MNRGWRGWGRIRSLEAGVVISLQWGRPRDPFSGPNRFGQSPGASLSGEGGSSGDRRQSLGGQTWAHLTTSPLPPPHTPFPFSPPSPRDLIGFDPAAPTSSSASAGQPLPAEAPRGRGVWRGARLRPPLQRVAAPSRRQPFSDAQGRGPGHLPASAT